MNVEIELPGIHPSPKTLASGERVTYYYAWKGKGAPRLKGEYGSPEFVASYFEAKKTRPAEPPKNLGNLLDQFAASKYFRQKLKSGTQISRTYSIRSIKRNVIAELTVASLSDPRTKEILETWRDNKAEATPGQARNDWNTLNKALTWAVDQRLIKSNPCRGVEPLRSGSRIDKIWSDDQIAEFCDKAPSHFVRAFILALWTGQRVGSLLKLRWSAYDGKRLWVEQEKNRKNQPPKVVVIPVMGAFKNFLDDLERKAGVAGLSKEERRERSILLNKRGRPWAHTASFGGKFHHYASKFVEDRTFHDLRGTAITRLARAECTVPQIAAITGHSLKTVQDILDKHYLPHDIVLAEQAMKKRDNYEVSQPPSKMTELDQ